MFQQYHEEIDNHQNLKDTVDASFHSLVENIQGDIERLKEKQTKLNLHWEELQTLVSDRFDELVLAESELEKVGMFESIEDLTNCLLMTRELDCVPVPGVGSSSLDDVKALVTKCQVSGKNENGLITERGGFVISRRKIRVVGSNYGVNNGMVAPPRPPFLKSAPVK